jgi:hypothetical protein
MAELTPTQKITMALLAAKLAREALELLTVKHADLARLQFLQIVVDLKPLDDHIKQL